MPIVSTRKFHKDFLKENVAYNHPSSKADKSGVQIITREIFDQGRWETHYEAVFKFEDKFYDCSFSMGSTESQPNEPFEYDGDADGMIELVEVAPVEKVIIAYEPVNLEEGGSD